MLKVTRLSAKFDILPLFSGKISISNIQLFGFNINPSSSKTFVFIESLLGDFSCGRRMEEKPFSCGQKETA
ncbi:hypothetical protein, partial [Bilophila wadsworthia]|uniref:hypothetical protein n=1 Tax=Bilophila wadsworthia TaxID=35833 RepID=UPI003AB6638B